MPPIRTQTGRGARAAQTTRHIEAQPAHAGMEVMPGADVRVDRLQPSERAIALNRLVRLGDQVESRLLDLSHRYRPESPLFFVLQQSVGQWRAIVARANGHLQTSPQAVSDCLHQIEQFLSLLDDQPESTPANPTAFVLCSQRALQQMELALGHPAAQWQQAPLVPAPLPHSPPAMLAAPPRARVAASVAARVATQPSVPAPSATYFVVRRTLEELQPLADGQVLPAPYADMLAHPMVVRDTSTQGARGRRQLRFFAAMEGAAQPFSVVGLNSGRAYVFDADAVAGDSMREVMRREFRNPGETFNLIFGDGAGIQLHGTQFSSSDGLIGPAVAFLSEEFTRALHIVWQHTTLHPHKRIFERFWSTMTEVCFDANITKLNQFLQEENLVGEDLSLVPNLEGKATPFSQMYEYLRVFRLHADRSFAARTIEPREDRLGNFHPHFVQHYFNDSLFLSYLLRIDAFAALTMGEVKKMIVHLKEADLLLACPSQP